jgi:NFU1 iron-sulfur cluster scaffold homolog, mitochondrial
MPTNPIKIIAETSADPNICKFAVDILLSPGRAINCRNKDAAQGSPLLEALFNIDGIREVLISGNVITIAKFGSEPWQDLGKKIGAAIRTAIESGQPPIPDDWGTKPLSENNLFQQVERILATRVNPGVSTHGGRVELVDVKGTSVYLRLSGGCQGCGAANVTLRQGIEKAIRSQLPEITEIIDITDHASGKNPFYKTTRTDGSPL